VHKPLLPAFPFPSTLGEVTLHLLSQAWVFIYSSRGKWVFPPLLWSFPSSAAFTSFPTPGCLHMLLFLPSPARHVYLQFCEGFPSPTSALRVPHPLCYVSFLLLLLIIQSLFPLGGCRSVHGAMLIWPRVVCGSTACRLALAHLVCIFPSRRLGVGVWWWRGIPPGFSVQCEVEMLCAGWRCGGVKILPLLGGFSCKVLSPASLQDFTLGGMLSASSL
jgi:hypothetical protein